MKIKEIYESKDDDKVELINSLNFDDYEDKWDLILEVIQDENEYDLARIEALKVIEIAKIPKIVVEELCNIVVNLLKNENDYDVRNYVFIASRNLINYSIEIKNCINEIILSQEEDIDIRHNAYSAILKIVDQADKIKILNSLLDDNVFSKYAKKDIN
ncbi:hypothetical protein LNQ49_20075 [Flavobacterium sp. F-65]|jgi:hypothetical protein|uniref:HEAT repeat-containing protein n=1 Tax=Flavobacterium pisciphilum TaxID=2893755 RepID=A0ABS8N0F9_9FLAO|nr:hypothetical protein [Flavobacterium sp. F-65]MCC9073886.1 hypothetical protein [Flavobacterium sp. F-65]